ncbi:MAG TPA: VCBS repeat-containing protein [Nannocystis sp.]
MISPLILAALLVAPADIVRFAPPEPWSDDFTAAAGWRNDRHLRMLADVDRDGRADVVGFGETGVRVALSTGEAFAASEPWVANYSYNQGWRVFAHPRYLVDIDADGMTDIVGFGELGVFVSRSTGAAFRPPALWLRDFGRSQGWRFDRHLRLLADVDGDRRPDVVAFGDRGVHVALAGTDQFTAPIVWLADFGYDHGWRPDRDLRVLADVDGDGRSDIVAFGDDGVYVALAESGRFAAPRRWIDEYGRAGGWQKDRHPRLVADVSGDGRPDIIGFTNSGTVLSLARERWFSASRRVLTEFGWDDGWDPARHLRLALDVDGDRRADLVAFGDDGVYVARSREVAFHPPALALADLGYSHGWRLDTHVRVLADVSGDGRPDIIAFGDDATLVAVAEP